MHTYPINSVNVHLKHSPIHSYSQYLISCKISTESSNEIHKLFFHFFAYTLIFKNVWSQKHHKIVTFLSYCADQENFSYFFLVTFLLQIYDFQTSLSNCHKNVMIMWLSQKNISHIFITFLSQCYKTCEPTSSRNDNILFYNIVIKMWWKCDEQYLVLIFWLLPL